MQAILIDGMTFMILVRTFQCVAVIKYVFIWIKIPETLCGTSIAVPLFHQKLFLYGVNITYLRLNHAIVNITLFILFVCYVWHERNGSIWVYYNPRVFEVFEKLLLFGPKCVQQLHKRYLPRTTCATDYFHILLQCLRLGVQEGVG